MDMQTGDIAETEAEAEAPEADANFSVERIVVNRNGLDTPALTITWGTPKRSMTVRELNLADQFDLVEVAGDRTANATWMAMAGLAWGVDSIDGVTLPLTSSSSKVPLQNIRGALNRIRPDGLAAYFKALRKTNPSEGAVIEAAKN